MDSLSDNYTDAEEMIDSHQPNDDLLGDACEYEVDAETEILRAINHIPVEITDTTTMDIGTIPKLATNQFNEVAVDDQIDCTSEGNRNLNGKDIVDNIFTLITNADDNIHDTSEIVNTSIIDTVFDNAIDNINKSVIGTISDNIEIIENSILHLISDNKIEQISNIKISDNHSEDVEKSIISNKIDQINEIVKISDNHIEIVDKSIIGNQINEIVNISDNTNDNVDKFIIDQIIECESETNNISDNNSEIITTSDIKPICENTIESSSKLNMEFEIKNIHTNQIDKIEHMDNATEIDAEVNTGELVSLPEHKEITDFTKSSPLDSHENADSEIDKYDDSVEMNVDSYDDTTIDSDDHLMDSDIANDEDDPGYYMISEGVSDFNVCRHSVCD